MEPHNLHGGGDMEGGCLSTLTTLWGLQELSGSSPKRRRAEDKDEGIGSPDIWEDEKAEDLRREMIELRQQLDKERSVRMMLEQQVRWRPLLARCRAACVEGASCGPLSFLSIHAFLPQVIYIYINACSVPGLGTGSKPVRVLPSKVKGPHL
jgi:hypothetical protein